MRRKYFHLRQLSQIHRHNPRYPFLNHRDTVDNISSRHRTFIVRHYYELAFFTEAAYDVIEFVNVCIVQWRIYLIENTERCWLQ